MVPGDDRAWKIKIKNLSPPCERALRNICQNLGPQGRKFLVKRIETSNPEVQRAIAEILENKSVVVEPES